MRNRLAVLVLAGSLAPSAARAQHGAPSAGARAVAPAPETRQFDFLIGYWELVVSPKVSSLAAKIHGSPKLAGTWKAWRALDGFGIEDELRIVDRSGNPATFVQQVRIWDPTGRRWLGSALDVYRVRFSTSTAEWTGSEMVATSTGTDPEGRPTQLRTRFTAITATSFRMIQDRSHDGGTTWDAAVLTIDAKRIGATAPR